MTSAYLGVDKKSGVGVFEPLGHLGIFGLTRQAGKTTSLRELLKDVVRPDGGQFLVFRTGTGEIDFPGYRSRPFFRAVLDWRSVESMLWTFLAEKPKVYRPIIMDAVHGAKSLDDVHRAIVDRGEKAKSGWVRDRTKELDVYFEEILPWLEEHPLASFVQLSDGGNVVDLEGWPKTVQQLVIASTLEFLMAEGVRKHPLVVVLPEAREFVPSDRATPVKLAADRLARMGAKLNLFLWIDSQALTGVDQQLLRNFSLILQGVQTSDLEVDRVSKALEVPPKLIRGLKVGDFILHTLDGVRTVHVPLTKEKPLPKNWEEDNVDAKERKAYESRAAELEQQVKARDAQVTSLITKVRELEQRVRDEHERAEANAKAAAANAVERIRSPFNRVDRMSAPGVRSVEKMMTGGEADPVLEHGADDFAPAPRERIDLHVQREVPDLTVHVKVVRIEATPKDNRGRLALLVADGFFDKAIGTGPIGIEYVRRGWMTYNPVSKGGGSYQGVKDALEKLTEWGFLTRPGGGDAYEVVAEARKRIRVVKED